MGESLLILNNSDAWLLDSTSGIPSGYAGACGDRVPSGSFTHYGGGVVTWARDPGTGSLFAACMSTVGPEPVNESYESYISHARASVPSLSLWPARIAIDTTLFNQQTLGTLAVLNDEIWSSGAGATLVRMQGPSIGLGGEPIAVTTTVLPLVAPATNLATAFGSVWALSGSTVTRVTS